MKLHSLKNIGRYDFLPQKIWLFQKLYLPLQTKSINNSKTINNMRTEVTISQVYWNKGLSDFFFRVQSLELLEQIVDMDNFNLDVIDDYCEANDWDLDELEEFLYSASLAEACDEFGIEYEDEDEDEEEEEDEDEEV